ncbi:MAG: glutathione S-transferase [Phenylobacterium zucineum]|nr:MAG: glutathione S-transferase [Phenylobacterium zucineum]
MDTLAAGHAAALWAGLHLLLILALSIQVVQQRRKHKVLIGDEGIPEMVQAVRALGNAVEYVPPALVGLAILALAGAAPVVIHLTGFVLFTGRFLHAVGLSRSGGASFSRTIGMILTWVAFLFLIVALLFYALP